MGSTALTRLKWKISLRPAYAALNPILKTDDKIDLFLNSGNFYHFIVTLQCVARGKRLNLSAYNIGNIFLLLFFY